MSLASIEKTVVGDIREGVQNAITWLTQVAETHLPAAEADIRAVAGSGLFKIIEDAVLTPAEEALIAELVSKLPALRASASAAAEAPAAEVPAGDGAAAGQSAA